MSKLQKIVLTSVIGTLFITCTGFSIYRKGNQKLPDSFFGQNEAKRNVTISKSEVSEIKKLSKELIDFWHNRSPKGTSSNLISISKSKLPSIAERSIRLMGRTEDEKYLSYLKEISDYQRKLTAKNKPNAEALRISPEVVQLAIGRIRSSKMNGLERVNFLLKNCEIEGSNGKLRPMNFDDLQIISDGASTKFKSKSEVPKGWRHVRLGSPAFHVLHEVLDILRQEKRGGREIKDVTQKLTLKNGFDIPTECSDTSATRELNNIFDYSFKFERFTTLDRWVVDDAMALPPEKIRLAVNSRLKSVIDNPGLYPFLWKKRFGKLQTPGMYPVFKLGEVYGDQTTKQLLKKFASKYPDPWAGGTALSSLSVLEQKQGFSLFPA